MVAKVGKIRDWIGGFVEKCVFLHKICWRFDLNRGGKTMAKPIKETPILFGEDALRFEARMKEKRTESPEDRARRMKIYEMLMATANF